MTFTPTAKNKVSTLNASSSTLTASSEYLGTSEDVSKYANVMVTILSDVPSASLGVKFEFSTDDSKWSIQDGYTYSATAEYSHWAVKVKAKYFRVRYTNGSTNQSSFSLQTILQVNESKDRSDSKFKQTFESVIDSFSRVRIGRPFTLISNNHSNGKKNVSVNFEAITGSATSVIRTASSDVLMSTTGTGSVIRRSRQRATYQPGKSLLIFMTGVLNNGTNPATVTTKIGYYDDDDGYYFQYNNSTISIVERTSASGSLVETVVNQSAWNINSLDGKINRKTTLDPSKTLIYWFNFEWLGVGRVSAGVVINGEFIKCHDFTHSNLLTTPYTARATLPPTYEISSTGGSGSMTSICYTAISEGGYRPLGYQFSANSGQTIKTINNIEPLIAIRLNSASKSLVRQIGLSLVCTSGGNTLVQVFRFYDTAATSILTGSSFVAVGGDSDVEYDISSTAVNTAGGILISSRYFANNQDNVSFRTPENGYVSVSNGVSDLIVICAETIGGSESMACAIDWSEAF